MDRITIEKEINERVEAIQWVAMNAMAALLYGPCFDDSARKMSGRIVAWINGLFLEPVGRVPVGFSPADGRTISPHSKFGITGILEGLRGGTGRDRHRGSPSRVLLAKTALMNLLQSNLDLFPAFIDQVCMTVRLFLGRIPLFFLNICGKDRGLPLNPVVFFSFEESMRSLHCYIGPF